jgi:hypothetical protein
MKMMAQGGMLPDRHHLDKHGETKLTPKGRWQKKLGEK